MCKIYYADVIYEMKCVVDRGQRSIKMIQGLTVAVPEGSELNF